MLHRRAFCACASAALVSSFASNNAHAVEAACAVMTGDRQRAINPDEALARLKQVTSASSPAKPSIAT
jgi:carbonic anhydrase